MLIVLCREHLDEVRDWARQNQLLEKLDTALFDLGEVIGRSNYVELYSDFAPHSFTFCLYRIANPEAPRGTPIERGRFVFNGGLIYHGPDSPGDGSFPALSVSLSRRTDARWEVHT
jgi:hypothetical protein